MFIHIRETVYIWWKRKTTRENPETSSPLLEREKKRKERKERHVEGII
jgi:hypothetical protein